MKKKLTIRDFERKIVNSVSYFSYKKGNLEICLEYCENGFDVAIYRDQALMESKYCTNVDIDSLIAITRAIALALKHANKLYKKYIYKKSNDKKESKKEG
ncbi:MAG: hypothetical protein ACFFDH_00200 [Promethearchaeota archaeon]